MKRPHDTGALPATKRQRNQSSDIHALSSVSSPIKDVESIRDQAEPYRLVTAKFPIDALTPIWTVGANRPINQAHKRRLCRIFQQQGVLRKEISHRLRIACTKAEVEKMQHHLRLQLEPETRPENEDGSVPARDSEWLSFDDWMQVNGTKAELMAGNHRVEALKEYVQRLELNDSERWWICDIYDKG